MIHHRLYEAPARTLNPANYVVQHYQNNGGVVLKDADKGTVLVFINCWLLGYTPEENADEDKQPEIAAKANAIFKCLISVHNVAFARGADVGKYSVRNAIKDALGIL